MKARLAFPAHMAREERKMDHSKSEAMTLARLWYFLARVILLATAIVFLLAAIRPAWAEGYDPSMIRLHVLAHSDALRDQEIKRSVRDAIRETAQSLCAQAADAEEAYAALNQSLDILKEQAAARARLEGYYGEVAVETGIYLFPDREYAGTLVPAGNYRAVRILLGSGEGQNWWCVLYPDLCFVDEACAEAARQGEEFVFYSSIARWLNQWLGKGDS